MQRDVLLNSKRFKINEFRIPEFTLRKGEMIRFWVEIIPRLEADSDGYWGAKKMQETIKSFNQKGKEIRICPLRVKRKLFEYMVPITAGDYLKKRYNFLTEEEIESVLMQFKIKPEFKIKALGTAHQKVFSIICEFQNNKIVSFDYYGLSPATEEQLTTFVKSELSKGKSAISFDNLHYKSENADSDRIVNLNILRE